MKFVQFTGEKGEKVYINPQFVTQFREYRRGTMILFHASSDNTYSMWCVVQEPIELVNQILSDN